MSHADQIRWDRRYRENQGAHQPAAFLRQIFDSNAWELRPGRALDVACGSGRNAVFLADKGFDVTAIDISPVALARAAERATATSRAISWQQADLENSNLQTAAYDLILNIDYLQRSLLAPMKAALKIGGFMIFESYLIDQQTIGRPSNPDYLLQHNELLDAFRDFRVLSYREGRIVNDGDLSFRASMLAQKTR